MQHLGRPFRRVIPVVALLAIIVLSVATAALAGGPLDPAGMTAEDLLRLLGRLAPHSKGANTVEVALHLRFALPLATLIGALISAPLAILFGRHGTYSAAALVVFLYYSSMQAARALGEVGYLVPLLAAWLPNGLFFLVGMVLLGRVERA